MIIFRRKISLIWGEMKDCIFCGCEFNFVIYVMNSFLLKFKSNYFSWRKTNGVPLVIPLVDGVLIQELLILDLLAWIPGICDQISEIYEQVLMILWESSIQENNNSEYQGTIWEVTREVSFISHIYYHYGGLCLKISLFVFLCSVRNKSSYAGI